MLGKGSETCGPKRNYFFRLAVKVFKKNSRKPYILGPEAIDIAKFFKMVHPSARSKLGPRFPSYSVDGIGEK